ncbi:MAG: MltA domain-containing protein, partial [Pseudomonadota bacterium]
MGFGLIFKKMATFSGTILLAGFLLLAGCAPALRMEAKSPQQALRRVRFFYPAFRDDTALSSLEQALERNLDYLNRIGPGTIFDYGPDKYTAGHVRDSQLALLDLLKKGIDPDELNRFIRKHYLVYKATGRPGKPQVLFTGYFILSCEGSLTPDDTYKYPLYKKPDDLIPIDLSLFSEKYKGEKILARIDGNRVIPFYSRHEIEDEMALKGRGLEIAWLKDPLDVAFLHIQGSGILKLPDEKTVNVGYAGKNGRPYRAIGRHLLELGHLKREEISMQSIRETLSKHPEILDPVLNTNPSYVFFRILGEGLHTGSLNIPITAGRSIALDNRIFPKGALAFISTRKPQVSREGSIKAWEDFSRFVMVQDTGGAIRGAGKADIFWGIGPYAELAAGHMKHEGDLYILIKKP